MKISTIYFKDENLFKMIDDLAHRERKSISEITRLALLEYLKIHGSGNPVYPLTNWTDNPQFVSGYTGLPDPCIFKYSNKANLVISDIDFRSL